MFFSLWKVELFCWSNRNAYLIVTLIIRVLYGVNVIFGWVYCRLGHCVASILYIQYSVNSAKSIFPRSAHIFGFLTVTLHQIRTIALLVIVHQIRTWQNDATFKSCKREWNHPMAHNPNVSELQGPIIVLPESIANICITVHQVLI